MNHTHVLRSSAATTPRLQPSTDGGFGLSHRRAILVLMLLGGAALLVRGQSPQPYTPPDGLEQPVRADGLTARPRPPKKTAELLTIDSRIRTSPGQRRRFTLGNDTTVYVNEDTILTLIGPRRI
jgi:hypothetical protein